MIKGCQRRIIMVKDTGSRYFDSAYFVLRKDLPKGSCRSDMLTEAHRMINACVTDSESVTVPSYHKSLSCKKQTKISHVLIGVALSLASASLTVAVMLVLN